MKRLVCFLSGAVLAASSVAAQPPAPGPVGLAQGLQNAYNQLKMNATQSADKMSDADYSSKPSTMPEVRTFGQLWAHLAQAQFGQCSAAAGEPNPSQGKQLEQELKTKAEFVKALADSFALCDKAFAALTDQKRVRVDQSGTRPDCPRRADGQHHRARQRDVRCLGRLPAREEHRSTVDGADRRMSGGAPGGGQRGGGRRGGQ